MVRIMDGTDTARARQMEPKRPARVTDGLTFKEMASELMLHSPPPPVPRPAPPPPEPEAASPPQPEAPLEARQEDPSDVSSESLSESPVPPPPDDPARPQAHNAEAESGAAARRRAQA